MDEENKTEEKDSKKISKPSWVRMKPEELEKIIVDLGKKGESPAKIGLILRDKYGVPRSKLLGRKVTKTLREHNVKFEDERVAVDRKISDLKEHIDNNKHDHKATRALTKKLWDLYHIKKKV